MGAGSRLTVGLLLFARGMDLPHSGECDDSAYVVWCDARTGQDRHPIGIDQTGYRLSPLQSRELLAGREEPVTTSLCDGTECFYRIHTAYIESPVEGHLHAVGALDHVTCQRHVDKAVHIKKSHDYCWNLHAAQYAELLLHECNLPAVVAEVSRPRAQEYMRAQFQLVDAGVDIEKIGGSSSTFQIGAQLDAVGAPL